MTQNVILEEQAIPNLCDDEMQIEKTVIKAKKKYNMYSAEEKRNILDEVFIRFDPLQLRKEDGDNLKEISKARHISIKSLKRWMLVGPERLPGGGRKVRDTRMVKLLLEWLSDKGKDEISKRLIKLKALEFSSYANFKASKGWYEKFAKRHKLLI